MASVNRFHTTTGNNESRAPVISADGRWVAFHSLATDLTYDSNPGGRYQVFAYDRTRATVKLVSYVPSPASSNATALPVVATNPVFSADSRFVFFTARSNTASGSLSNMAIFRHDLLNDPIITTTNVTNGPFVFLRTNLTRLTNEVVCNHCANPAVSADGRLVAYEAAGADGATNVVVRDLQIGSLEFISADGNVPGLAQRPLLSLDGRYVAFTTRATGPFIDPNNATDVFVQDRRTRVTHLVSRALRRSGPQTGPPPDAGNGRSADPVLSYDGRVIAFHSFASDLVAGDFNGTRDVFVVSLGGGDIDRDGLDDDWELAYFNTLAVSGGVDSDGDGMDNLAEFKAGTDPTNEGSVFTVLTLTLAANWFASVPRATITVIWSAVPGRTYRVQTKSSLDAPWTDVPDDVPVFTASGAKMFDVMFPPQQAYFRVVLVE